MTGLGPDWLDGRGLTISLSRGGTRISRLRSAAGSATGLRRGVDSRWRGSCLGLIVSLTTSLGLGRLSKVKKDKEVLAIQVGRREVSALFVASGIKTRSFASLGLARKSFIATSAGGGRGSAAASTAEATRRRVKEGVRSRLFNSLTRSRLSKVKDLLRRLTTGRASPKGVATPVRTITAAATFGCRVCLTRLFKLATSFPSLMLTFVKKKSRIRPMRKRIFAMRTC